MAKYNKPLVIVKIGGKIARNVADILLADMAILPAKWILIHGGGIQVNEISRIYGIEPYFIDGVRQTSPVEMQIIDMGLAGIMNTTFLRQAQVAGLRPIGLNGVSAGLFTAEKLSSQNHTGRIISINPEIIHYLLAADYLPIISSVSSNPKGEGVNVNADDTALALAKAVNPAQLIFISDVDGVFRRDLDPTDSAEPLSQKGIISNLDEKKADAMIKRGIINGGMIPKVKNALRAAKEDVDEVFIASIDKSGDLENIMKKKRGTAIVR